ncbi:glycoside hydrolase family 61 protein [Pleurotus ostreatus PC15]|uniref:lytic cellulose monooxygenase (C4-dehydrogenating) n=1 Tax=Pleurotus ostreatus (strain PC15) TaxID=1137138 RepID=A0A067NPI2_PLEO1|nr:glycoside hydrolase family 61 protein [Pleurotus ostreatus PC15]
MRLSVAIALATAIQFVGAHYTFPQFIVNGTTSSEWEYVRITENHWSNGPIQDVTSNAFRCFELDSTSASQTNTATVRAGSTVGFKASNTMGHPGYFSAYMTPASPAANSDSAGTGNTWFKVWEWAPGWSASTGLIFDSMNINEVSFPIPASLPNGQYLIRIEQIALHIASNFGDAQFYIGCAQVNVVGGGNGSPFPTTSFPGAYTGNEPGIKLNIYALPAGYSGYTPPGPPVWHG